MQIIKILLGTGLAFNLACSQSNEKPLNPLEPNRKVTKTETLLLKKSTSFAGMQLAMQQFIFTSLDIVLKSYREDLWDECLIITRESARSTLKMNVRWRCQAPLSFQESIYITGEQAITAKDYIDGTLSFSSIEIESSRFNIILKKENQILSDLNIEFLGTVTKNNSGSAFPFKYQGQSFASSRPLSNVKNQKRREWTTPQFSGQLSLTGTPLSPFIGISDWKISNSKESTYEMIDNKLTLTQKINSNLFGSNGLNYYINKCLLPEGLALQEIKKESPVTPSTNNLPPEEFTERNYRIKVFGGLISHPDGQSKIKGSQCTTANYSLSLGQLAVFSQDLK